MKLFVFVSIILTMCFCFFSFTAMGSDEGTTNKNASQIEGKILVATCQFPVSRDIKANADWIRKQMREAHEQNADVVHFPETAFFHY